MSWLMATAHAYDVMGSVFITAEVRSAEGPQGTPPSVVLRATTTVDGVGETNPHDWLSDVLVALLETL